MKKRKKERNGRELAVLVPPPWLRSYPRVNLWVLSAWAVSLCAGDPMYFYCPGSGGPTDVMAPSVGVRHKLALCSAWLYATKSSCQRSGVRKSRVAQGDLWGAFVSVCVKALSVSTQLGGMLPVWNDIQQGVPLQILCTGAAAKNGKCGRVVSSKHSLLFVSAKTHQWHGIMELICWKTKGFSRTLVNYIKEGFVTVHLMTINTYSVCDLMQGNVNGDTSIHSGLPYIYSFLRALWKDWMWCQHLIGLSASRRFPYHPLSQPVGSVRAAFKHSVQREERGGSSGWALREKGGSSQSKPCQLALPV